MEIGDRKVGLVGVCFDLVGVVGGDLEVGNRSWEFSTGRRIRQVLI